MKYIHNVGTIKEPKRLLAIVLALAFALTSTLSVLSITKAATDIVWDQGFESNTDGWLDDSTSWGYGIVTQKNTGDGGINAKTGTHYALMEGSNGSGPFSRFDGYRYTWPGSYAADIDVYLDPSWADGTGFDYTVASSKNDGSSHLRDFIFHVTKDSSTHELLVAGSNNTNFAPREDLESINHYSITSPGWYTLQHVFRDQGGSLAVDLNLLDSDGNNLWHETRNNVSDDISSIVGGNRYSWFTFINVAGGVAVDNHLLSLTKPDPVTGMSLSQNGTIIGCGAYVNNRAIIVSWNASTNPDFDHYIYQADDGVGPIDFTTNVTNNSRSGNIRDLDGTYQYRVREVDSFGNQGEWSNWCSVTLDRSAPETPELVSPSNGAIVKGGPTQTWSDSSTDVDHYIYESFSDEGLNSPVYDTTVKGTSRKVGGLQTITIWWRVTAVDKAGNESAPSDAWKLVIDNTNPLITLDNPIDDSTLRGISTFTGTASDTNSGLRNNEIRLSFRPIIDGNIQTPVKTLRVPVDGSGNWTIDFDTSDLDDGSYRIVARANDNLGANYTESNTSAATIDAVIDNKPNNKEACKNEGWANYSVLSFRNQGDCVSWTVSAKQQEDNPDANRGSKKPAQFSLEYSQYLFGTNNKNNNLKVR